MNGKICNINASEKNLYGKKETIMEYRDIEKSLNYLDIFADSDELLCDAVNGAYDLIVKYLEQYTKRICAVLTSVGENTNFDINVYGGKRAHTHAGLIQHHCGVGFDIKGKRKSKYYLSMVSMNREKNSKNIHSVLGRIQFMISRDSIDAGNPNRMIEGENGIEVAYPFMDEKQVLRELKEDEWQRFFEDRRNQRVFYTGYKIMGREGEDAKADIVLNSKNIEQFCRMILNIINFLEN